MRNRGPRTNRAFTLAGAALVLLFETLAHHALVADAATLPCTTICSGSSGNCNVIRKGRLSKPAATPPLRWPRTAVRSLTECLKIDPYYAEALHDLAHAYLALDQGQLANEVLEAALEHPRARPEALSTLVTVNLALDDRDTARRWARTAAAEIPGFDLQPSVAALLAGEKQ